MKIRFSKNLPNKRIRLLFILLILILSLFYIYNTKLQTNYCDLRNNRSTYNGKDTKMILQWELTRYTPFEALEVGNWAFVKNNCKFKNCFVTNCTKWLDESEFDAVVFNGWEIMNYGVEQLPKRRSPKKKYIFGAMESADNYPICNEIFDGYFNWTWTYKIDSDFRWGYMTIYDLDGNVLGPSINMQWQRELKPIGEDIINKLSSKSKAAAWFVSHCATKSRRENFVNEVQRELIKYGWTVDIYGDCGTLSCPKSSSACYDLIENDYYFYFSLENSFSEDYVTEKLLTALNHYSVPVVYGSANYSRFLPPGSYLDGRELGTKKLAQLMSEIIGNRNMYHDFFRWRNHYKYKGTSFNDDVCKLCEMVNNEEKMAEVTVWYNLRKWWNGAKNWDNC